MSAEPEVAPPSHRPGQVGRNVVVLGASQVATWGLALVWTLFVPRALGPRGMGLLVMAWSSSGILLVVAGLGTRTLLVQRIAADPSVAPRLLGTAIALRAVFVVPCVVLVGLYIEFAHFGGTQVAILWLATGLTILLLFVEPFQAMFQAVERMEYLAYGEVLNKIVVTACGIALVLLGFGAVSLVSLTVLAAGILLILNLIWLRRHVSVSWEFDWKRVRTLFAGSLSYWAYSFFFTFYLWIDSAMLAVLTPTRVVGWYGVPTKLFGTLLFIPVVLSTAWLPRFAAAFRQSPEQLRAVARAPIELIVILSLPVSVGAALVAGPLIQTLYGSAFAPSAPVFATLSLVVIPMYLNIMVYQVLVASHRQMLWTRVLAGACIVNPLLNFVLIQFFQSRTQNGAIGAAISLLVTEVVAAVVGIGLIRGLLDLRTVNRLGRAVLATIGMAAVVQLAAHLNILAQILAGGLTFAVLALILRVPTADEVAAARRRLGGIWRFGER